MAKALDYLSRVLRNALVFISLILHIILCSNGLGHLLHLSTIYFSCFYFLVAYTRKPIKSYVSVLAVIPFSRSLVYIFCSSLGSTLLLIEKAMIDPLNLWVISKEKQFV